MQAVEREQDREEVTRDVEVFTIELPPRAYNDPSATYTNGIDVRNHRKLVATNRFLRQSNGLTMLRSCEFGDVRVPPWRQVRGVTQIGFNRRMVELGRHRPLSVTVARIHAGPPHGELARWKVGVRPDNVVALEKAL